MVEALFELIQKTYGASVAIIFALGVSVTIGVQKGLGWLGERSTKKLAEAKEKREEYRDAFELTLAARKDQVETLEALRVLERQLVAQQVELATRKLKAEYEGTSKDVAQRLLCLVAALEIGQLYVEQLPTLFTADLSALHERIARTCHVDFEQMARMVEDENIEMPGAFAGAVALCLRANMLVSKSQMASAALLRLFPLVAARSATLEGYVNEVWASRTPVTDLLQRDEVLERIREKARSIFGDDVLRRTGNDAVS